MIKFPIESRPHERSILLIWHILGIKNPQEIAVLLGYRTPSQVYRCLRKYNGVQIVAEGQMVTRTVTITPIG